MTLGDSAESRAGRVRLNLTGREAQQLRKEVDDLALKSVRDILVDRQQRRTADSDNATLQSYRKMAPNFIPKPHAKPKSARKDLPAPIPPNMQKRPITPGQRLPAVDVPSYNPLEKSAVKPKPERTKKFPFSQDNVRTVSDMRQPRITSMGIYPIRDSLEVDKVNVMMKGRPLEQKTEAKVTEEAGEGEEEEEECFSAAAGDQRRHSTEVAEGAAGMPMIVGGAGTVQRAAMARKAERPPLPPFRRARPAKSASSIRSGDLEPARDRVLGLEDDAESQASSEHSSIKSTKELLDEARAISKALEAEPKGAARRGSQSQSQSRRGSRVPGLATARMVSRWRSVSKRGSSLKPREGPSDESRSTVRSVDEIIASLKDPSSEQAQSESDKKIDELMDQIFSRSTTVVSSALVGEEAGVAETETEAEAEAERDEGAASEDDSPAVEETAAAPLEAAEESIGPKAAAAESALMELTKEMHLELPDREDEAIDDGTPAFSVMESAITSAPPRPVAEMTDAEALRYLSLPDQITHEDLVSVTGLPAPQAPKAAAPKAADSPLQAEHKEADREGIEKSIHFFCTYRPQSLVVHPELRQRWAREHVPDKFVHGVLPSGRIEDDRVAESALSSDVRRFESPSVLSSTTSRPIQPSPSASEVRIREAADAVMGAAEEELEAWQEAARRAIESALNLPLEVTGERMIVPPVDPPIPWAPAPPKMQATPFHVRRVLFPSYQSYLPDQAGSSTGYDSSDDDSEGSQDDAGLPASHGASGVDPEFEIVRHRVLSRRYESFEDLSALELAKKARAKSARTTGTEAAADTGTELRTVPSPLPPTVESDPPVRLTFSELREKMAAAAMHEASEHSGNTPPPDIDPFPHFPAPRRTSSVPTLHIGRDADLMVHFVYDDVMKELNRQSELIAKQKADDKAAVRARAAKAAAEAEKAEAEAEMEAEAEREAEEEQLMTPAAEEEEEEEEEKATGGDVAADLPVKSTKKKATTFSRKGRRPTAAELALQAGRSYVIMPKKRQTLARPRRAKHTSMERIDAIERFLNAEPNRLERQQTLACLRGAVDYELRVPRAIRVGRRNSVPNVFEFDSWARLNGFKNDQDPRDWVVNIWDEWFDEVYPPLEDDPPYSQRQQTPPARELEPPPVASVAEAAKAEEGQSGTSVSEQPVELPEQIDIVLDDVAVEEREEIASLLKEEVMNLTMEIETSPTPNAFLLCRRGALNRKIGALSQSLADLNAAIDLEPLMLDAYWHRHLLYLLQNRLYDCLDDLNFLLKHQRTNSGAYKSRAEVYRRLNDVTMAIINYSQAIKLNPNDAEAHFRRAEMYEQRGEMRLALEDYQKTTKLQPNKIDAIFKHGYYYFQNEQWQFAIADFSELLKQDPTASLARTYRGRALVKLGLWAPALQDLSAAVHLDPNNSLAYFYRGCMLRKAQPEKALMDLSISLLIDDSEENVMAFLHRGILYCELERPEDAIADFEAVTELNSEIPCAHVNLGLIYFNMNLHQKAIKFFSAAVKVDPTYVRAFVCRAEAYSHLHDYKNALLDITRAIHLYPNNPHYYMFRGQLVLKTGNLDLAAFCVRHAAEMNEGLGTSATQQALVQSFLGNFDRGIDALQTAVKSKPNQANFSLLGRTQMKAAEWKDATASLMRCLDLMKPWSKMTPWPFAAAEINFLLGQCHMELRDFVKAHEFFNAAIHINPRSSEAFYQRGLCKMRLRMSKAIQDFNRGLAIDPSRYQIYLSRAAYYGMRKRYTKGILNCNEAIKLQPKSVRSYLYRGALKFHIRAFGLAVEDLSHAARIDSSCSLAYFNRALCHHEARSFDKALRDYGIVLLCQDPALSFKVLINRGLLYLDLGDAENALMDFLLAAESQPKDHRLMHTIGLCYHKLGRLVDAIRAFSRALDLNPLFLDSYIGRGNTYMDFGHTQGLVLARRDYQRILLNAPEHHTARLNLALNLQVAGKFWQAWRQFTIVLNYHPNSPRALEGRAVVCLQMSNPTAALQDLDRAVALRASAEVLTSRGVVHQFLGDRVNAMRDYRRASLANPNFALAYYNMANIYLLQQQFLQAGDFYSRCLELNPRDEGALVNRALVRMLRKDISGAQEDFKAAIKLSPYSAHMFFNRGNLFLRTGDLEKAEKDFNKALTLLPDDATALKARADCRGRMGKRELAMADYKRAVFIASKLRGE